MELDTVKIWKDTLETIKISVSPAIFSTWFSQTHLHSLKRTDKRYVAEVGCVSPFIKSEIERRYFGLIQDSLTNFLDNPCDISFVIKDNPNKKTDIKPSMSPLFDTKTQEDGDIRGVVIEKNLRSTYTFQNFAVSSSNQMAWAAADAVSKELGNAYNPLFIWGGVGNGKTHLMNAVGYSALQKDHELPVLFTTGEQFTNDIVEGIRNKSTSAVRSKYRKLRLLMVDDIQFIAGKDTIQEEFFHTFNALVSVNSQVILTSDRPPSEISKLEERLRSRFEAGLIVDIAPPDFELRCAITQIKAKERNFDIPMDIIQLIAGNLETPRKIEGFLVRLSSEVLVKHSEITPDFVESLLGKREDNNGRILKVNPNKVIGAVSKYYSIGKRNLLGNSRARPVARPRQILMYLLRTELQLPLEEVGRLIGGRDHTTVMHAVDTITQMASKDVHIREDIRGIKGLI